jgi:hypothetical protein
MPRKAKGTELNQEQILEMQALFEGSDYGSVKIAEIINERHKIAITEGAVRHYAKKEGWVKGKKKEYYNAKKVAKIQELTARAKQDDEEYKLITKISKQAEKEGEKIALLTLQSESFKKQIEHEYAEILLLQMQNVKSTLEATKGGKITDTEFEYVDTIQGKTGTVLRKTKTLTMKDHGMDLIKLGQALGSLQTQPTALIQNNNNQANSQGGEGMKDNKLYSTVQEDPEYQEFVLKQAEKFKKS